ncbi:MAG: hypothetical protein LUG52_03835 [Clostridia bacterium]|nr:hypothetical protein [Clostridia bacterium]
MEKTRRFLYVPLAYHAALDLSMVILYFMGSSTLFVFWLMELIGVLLSPLFMAIMGMMHTILHNGKPLDYWKISCIYLAIIMVLRIAAYAVQSAETVAFAFETGIVAFGIYFLWTGLFTLSDKLMNSRRKKR